jgi:hypothetical protein
MAVLLSSMDGFNCSFLMRRDARSMASHSAEVKGFNNRRLSYDFGDGA